MTTSALRRQVKNIVHNYSEAEIKVREATSNDPWGPSSSLMSEIADLTFNVVAFAEVMGMVWKRLNDSGKNWRHVYKVCFSTPRQQVLPIFTVTSNVCVLLRELKNKARLCKYFPKSVSESRR
uniref:ENTH domain-containing protein n=2 Tax=Xiphophorus TaxID=8082 RepID=A0A3B5PQ19_XIPMA